MSDVLGDAQHAWEASFRHDELGRPVLPRFHRLLFFNAIAEPDRTSVERLEQAFASLEERFSRTPDGLLTVIGWSTGWFERHTDTAPPIGRAARMARWEDPVIDDFDGFIHLASDHEDRVESVAAELFGPGPLDQRETLELAEVRSGFVGDGIPRERLAGLDIPETSPLLLGFRSALRRNQAPEENITIVTGPFAGGTTAHVSRIELNVAEWHRRPRDEQSALLHAPTVTAQQADALADDARSDYDKADETVDRYGIIGHAQAAARARVNDVPLINRRDFATVDDGAPGTHFVALQRDLRDFNNTRAIMNGADAATRSPRVGPRHRNGINAFMNVTRRAAYLVPPRRLRAFPCARAAGGAGAAARGPAAQGTAKDPVLTSVAEILATGTVPSVASETGLLREAVDILQQSRVTSLLVDAALGLPTGGRRSQDVAEALGAIHPQLGLLAREHYAVSAQALADDSRRLSGDVGRGLVVTAALDASLDWPDTPTGGTDLRVSGQLRLPGDAALYDIVLIPLPWAAPGRQVAALPTYREGLTRPATGGSWLSLHDVVLLKEEQLGLDWPALARRLGRRTGDFRPRIPEPSSVELP